jgi:hypothetical protein
MSEIGVELLAVELVFEFAVGALVFFYVKGCYGSALTRIESLPGFIWDALNYRLSRRDVAKDHPRQY